METPQPNALIYDYASGKLIEGIIENEQIKIRIPLHGGGEYYIPIPPNSKYTIYPGTPKKHHNQTHFSKVENRVEGRKPKWMENTNQKILDDIAEGP
jgi:hypothetical protein